jgi:hypothetical protein
MQAEPRLFDDHHQAGLSEGEQAALYEALQAAFSPDADQRSAGLAHIRELEGHQQSPLVAAALVHRLHEPNVKLLSELVALLASILEAPHSGTLASPSRRWASHALRQLGMREIDNLLKLARVDDTTIEPVALILNECSLAGEMLVEVFTDGLRDLDHRLLAIDLIDRVGFLEAIPMIEHWITRLTSRQERQLRMSFAPAPDPETETVLPALRQALASLEGSGQA